MPASKIEQDRQAIAAVLHEVVVDPDDLIPTRKSLLIRLKNFGDNESWRDFFDTYWRLIYRMALRLGLDSHEAQDAVQETVISVMKSMPKFEYDAEKGSFKAWLKTLTVWRVRDQHRKRERHRRSGSHSAELAGEKMVGLEEIPDSSRNSFDALWDEEWDRNILFTAVEKVRKGTEPGQFQIFDLHILKEWPVAKVAAFLKISRAQVYLYRHRVGRRVKKEVRLLQARSN